MPKVTTEFSVYDVSACFPGGLLHGIKPCLTPHPSVCVFYLLPYASVCLYVSGIGDRYQTVDIHSFAVDRLLYVFADHFPTGGR